MFKKSLSAISIVFVVGLANIAAAHDWHPGNENVISYSEFQLSYDPPGPRPGEAGWQYNAQEHYGDDNKWSEHHDGRGKHAGSYLVQKNSEKLADANVLELSLRVPPGRYVVALQDVFMHGGQDGGGGAYYVTASIEGIDAYSDKWNEGYGGTVSRLFLGDGSCVKADEMYDVYNEPNFLVADGTLNIELGTAYTNDSSLNNWFSFSGFAITRISGSSNRGPAWRSYPLDEATIEYQDLELSWTAGDYATAFDVYLGEDFGEVNSAVNPVELPGRGRRIANSYVAGALELGKTYYWRVDVHDLSNMYRGDVWSFAVKDHVAVDDFDSYRSKNNPLERVWSCESDSIELENRHVHGGDFSMAVGYNNTAAPYYTEAVRAYTEAADWTAGDVDVLALYFRGSIQNTYERMYITVEDAAGQSVVIPYSGDANDLMNVWWQVWQIGLEEFSGVDLGAVKKVRIGFGDKNNTAPAGAGIVYLDDIKLYPGTYAPYAPSTVVAKPSASELLKFADTYEKIEDYNEAKWVYDTILIDHPDTNDAFKAQGKLALLYIAEGNDVAVEAVLDSMIADFNDHPRLAEAVLMAAGKYYGKGRANQRDGLEDAAKDNYGKAIGVWEKVIEKLPVSEEYTSRAYFSAAVVYSQELGEYQKGIDYYKTVVSNWPDSKYGWHAQYLAGKYYGRLKNSGQLSGPEANQLIEQAYRAVVENYPDCRFAGRSCLNLARLCKNAGRLDEQAGYLELFLTVVEPNDPEIEGVQARLAELGGSTE